MAGFTPGNTFGTGRPKGSGNKATEKVRKTIEKLTDQRYSDLVAALEEVREDNPKAYVELYLKLLEFSVPKLRSIDTKVDLGADTISNIKIEVINTKTPSE